MSKEQEKYFESIKQHLENREIAIKLWPFPDHLPEEYKTPEILNRIDRINKLVALYSPDVIVENERKILFELINNEAAKQIFETIRQYFDSTCLSH